MNIILDSGNVLVNAKTTQTLRNPDQLLSLTVVDDLLKQNCKLGLFSAKEGQFIQSEPAECRIDLLWSETQRNDYNLEPATGISQIPKVIYEKRKVYTLIKLKRKKKSLLKCCPIEKVMVLAYVLVW